jgi:hypothetical protein
MGHADAVLPLKTGGRGMKHLVLNGTRSFMTVGNAGHFLQEDRGESVGGAIFGWVESL